jgi:hypothetical protein
LHFPRRPWHYYRYHHHHLVLVPQLSLLLSSSVLCRRICSSSWLIDHKFMWYGYYYHICASIIIVCRFARDHVCIVRIWSQIKGQSNLLMQ